MKGDEVSIQPRRKTTSYVPPTINNSTVSGIVRIRVREHGYMSILAVNRRTMEPLSLTTEIKVSICDEDVLILPLFSESVPTSPNTMNVTATNFSKPPPSKLFSLNGIFAVSGLTPIILSHESISNTVSICNIFVSFPY